MDDIEAQLTAALDATTARRFLAKIRVTEAGCWEWTAAKMKNGYGRFGTGTRAAQKIWFSHRFAYTYLIGPIPDGLVLDHYACENKGCANPSHVRPVTRRENTLRGDTLYARNLAKTHCPQGHPYAGENLRVSGKNQRYCRTCGRASARRARTRSKE